MEDDMRKLVTLILVLGLATVANASLLLSVDGDTDPGTVNVDVYDTLNIDIWGDGATAGGSFYLGISTGGAGSLDIDSIVWYYVGDTQSAAWLDDSDVAGVLGVDNPFVNLMIGDYPSGTETPDPLSGTLLDNIIFACSGEGELTILLYDGEGGFLDDQIINQVPEPMTLALLGLGGLLLRRK